MDRVVVLASHPVGMPKESDFRVEERPVPVPQDDEVVVRNAYLSMDPYMRHQMRPGVSELGRPLGGGAVGRVVRSRHAGLSEGDWVRSGFGWREGFVSGGGAVEKVGAPGAPVSAHLGVLGVTGFTAWQGLTGIGCPQPGETLLVSAAAGAVGSVVGQVGKLIGCRVVGVVGSQAKREFVTGELGFDAAIDYNSEDDLRGALADACPDGIDIYFDNVGGPVLEAALSLVNPQARVPLCGMISQYNLEGEGTGPRMTIALVMNRVRVEGYLIGDHGDRHAEFLQQMSGWLRDGKVKSRETVVEGIERAPQAFIGLMKGDNVGKMLVKVGPGPEEIDG